MGKPQPPDPPSEKPSDPIAREQLDDLIELALEQRRAKSAQADETIDVATAESIAAEVGISPDELAQARRALAARQSRWWRLGAGAGGAGLILAGGLWLATPAPPPDWSPPAISGTAADRAHQLRLQGDEVRKKQNRPWEALELYREAVTLAPNDTNAWNDLGIGFKAVGDYAKAETAYRKAIAVGKDHPDAAYAMYNLANILDDGPRKLEAIPLYEESIRRRPFAPDNQNNLGVLYERLGRYDEAIAMYRKAIEVNPGYQRGRNNLRILQEALAKRSGATGTVQPH